MNLQQQQIMKKTENKPDERFDKKIDSKKSQYKGRKIQVKVCKVIRQYINNMDYRIISF